MLKRKNLPEHFFYPYCKEVGCNGHLNISFNNNYSLDCFCDKNGRHKTYDVYFKTFERFYLKEKKIDVCSKCSSKLDDASYECIICDKLYCILCFTKDKHIKKNISNLKITTKKCLLHNRDLTQYCHHCDKLYCIYCLKDDETHKEHSFQNLLDLIPSNNEIINLTRKIQKKKFFYEEIISSIEEWQRTLMMKTNQLKQNLRDEISLLEKICFNFNNYYINNTYLSLFYDINKYIDRKNKLLNEFNNCFKIEEKTKLLFKLCDINNSDINNEYEVIQTNENYELFYDKNEGFIEKINNKLYLELINKTLRIIKLNSDNNFIYNNNEFIEFKEKIYSVSISPKKRQIFACLADKKIVKIFDYTEEDLKIKISKDEIIDNSETSGHFNKCIDIINRYIVTSDNKNIIIWKNNTKKFIKFKIFDIGIKTSDLLFVNGNYIISSQPQNKTISIYDIKNLIQEKIITNIDSIDSYRCLLKYKDYIIINCERGIVLFSVKTRELCQYIENYKKLSKNKEIFLDDMGKVCILNKYMSKEKKYVSTIIRFEMVYGSLKPFEETNKIITDYDLNNIICLINERFVLFDKYIYSINECKK